MPASPARARLLVALLCLASPVPLAAAGPADFDQTFLADYAALVPVSGMIPGDDSEDLAWVAPDGFGRLSRYTAVLVDQPESRWNQRSGACWPTPRWAPW